MQQVNKYVYQDAKVSEVFATLSILLINNIDKTVRYAGAGDLPILFKQYSKNVVKTVKSKGLLLGYAPDGDFKEESVQLEPNDLILLATDGIIEARSSAGNQFGSEKLRELIKNLNGHQSLLESLQNELNSFTLGKFEDDVSAIVIKAV